MIKICFSDLINVTVSFLAERIVQYILYRYFYLVFMFIFNAANFYLKIFYKHDIHFCLLLSLRLYYSSYSKNHPTCCNYSNVQFACYISAMSSCSFPCTDARFGILLIECIFFLRGSIDILVDLHDYVSRKDP